MKPAKEQADLSITRQLFAESHYRSRQSFDVFARREGVDETRSQSE